MPEDNSSAIEQAEDILKITKPPSPEILEKFSTGDIQLSNDLMIKGEGQDRTLYVTVRPDDSLYKSYREELGLFVGMRRENDRLGNRASASDIILDMINSRKKLLKSQAVPYKLSEFINTNLRNFTAQFEGLSQDESQETLERRKEIEGRISNFNDLLGYTMHIGMKAVQITLPEESR